MLTIFATSKLRDKRGLISLASPSVEEVPVRQDQRLDIPNFQFGAANKCFGMPNVPSSLNSRFAPRVLITTLQQGQELIAFSTCRRYLLEGILSRKLYVDPGSKILKDHVLMIDSLLIPSLIAAFYSDLFAHHHSESQPTMS